MKLKWFGGLAIISILIGAFSTNFLFEMIRWLLPTNVSYIAYSPFDGFMLLMYIGLGVAVITFFFGSLFILWREYNDALHLKEKEFLFKSLTPCVVLFVIGLVFGFLVYSKLMLPFFIETNNSLGLVNNWNLYTVMLSGLSLAFMLGLAFQLPVLIKGLIFLGLVTKDQLRKQRKFVIVGVLIISGLITPTPDILSQLIVGLPLYALFEVSLL